MLHGGLFAASDISHSAEPVPTSRVTEGPGAYARSRRPTRKPRKRGNKSLRQRNVKRQCPAPRSACPLLLLPFRVLPVTLFLTSTRTTGLLLPLSSITMLTARAARFPLGNFYSANRYSRGMYFGALTFRIFFRCLSRRSINLVSKLRR